MSKFFINRPIVAIVISILMVLAAGLRCWNLPTSQFPNIADPMIQVKATYPGADAATIAQSVATPDRAADVGRQRHELHVLAERQLRRGMTLYVDFATRHRHQHRPDSGADAPAAGKLAVAIRGNSAGRHRAAGNDRPVHAARSVFANGTTTTSSSPTTPRSICSTR